MGTLRCDNFELVDILQGLEDQWRYLQKEKNLWEAEKSELEAKLSFLLSEKMGQENLKVDLIRRIKMLEFSLKEERNRNEILQRALRIKNSQEGFCSIAEITNQYSRSVVQDVSVSKADVIDTAIVDKLAEVPSELVNSNTILQIVLESFSNGKLVDCEDNSTAKKKLDNTDIAAFEEMEKIVNGGIPSCRNDGIGRNESLNSFDIHPSEVRSNLPVEAFDDFSFNSLDQQIALPYENTNYAHAYHRWMQNMNPEKKTKKQTGRIPLKFTMKIGIRVVKQSSFYKTDQIITCPSLPFEARYFLRSHFDSVLDIHAVANENIIISASEDGTLKMWNLCKSASSRKPAVHEIEPIYTFRGHSGPVLRCAFNSFDQKLFSSSLFGEIFVWDISAEYLDPYQNYDPKQDRRLISSDVIHTDAVWSLDVRINTTELSDSTISYLLSASSDGTIKLWNATDSVNAFVRSYSIPSNCFAGRLGKSTDLQSWTRMDVHDAVDDGAGFLSFCTAAFSNFNSRSIIFSAGSDGVIAEFDLETGNVLQKCAPSGIHQRVDSRTATSVNAITSHPHQPLILSAHEDGCIRIYDCRSSKLVKCLQASINSISSICLDKSSLHTRIGDVLAGDHGGTLRLWNLDHQNCLKEASDFIPNKYDSSLNAVHYLCQEKLAVCGGSDGAVRIFS